MRFNTARFALAVTLLGAVAFSTTAWAGGWFSSDDKEVTLEELLRNPDKYIKEEVVFTVYFNRVAEQHNPYYTEFHAELYGNFTAWPIDARLYEKRDFQRSYPHFYVNKYSGAWKSAKKLKRFEAIECVGVVKQVFQGRPYIEIIEMDEVSYGMDEDEVKAGIRANAHYLAGNYSRAAQMYERALNASVPGPVRADLNRRLGDARFGAKQYDSARSAYRRALRDAPNSAVLKKNIAACSQAVARGNGDTAAQIAPTKTIAHHLEPIGDGTANGVDAVIAALEDPEKVAAVTTEENIELARRSVHGADVPGIVAVSNSDPAEEAAEEPMEAAAEGEDMTEEETVEVEVEEVPEAVEETMPEEPKAEEPAKEVPVEVIEEPKPEEPKAEEPAKEEPAEVIEETKPEEPKAEEPAKEEPAEVIEETKPEEPKAEEPAKEEPAEVVEETKPEEIKPEEPKAEEPAKEVTVEVIEDPKPEEPKADEPKMDEPPMEQPVEVVENDEPMAEEGMEEAPAAPNAGPEEEMVPAAPEENNPRVMKVGDTVTMLPRLPFHGCAGVSYEAFRAVVEEIRDTEDPLEVAGFESEIEVSTPEADDTMAEPMVEPVDAPEAADEMEDEAGEDPSEEQGQPEQSDEPVAEPAQPEQPEENPGQEPGQDNPEKPDMFDVD